MFEAILGVDHDLSNLYHGYFMFLGALRVYSARVASYKKASTPSLSNHNSHLWRITSIALFSSFSSWSTCAHLLETSLVDAFLVLVDDS
jgi:hypothetical protein